ADEHARRLEQARGAEVTIDRQSQDSQLDDEYHQQRVGAPEAQTQFRKCSGLQPRHVDYHDLNATTRERSASSTIAARMRAPNTNCSKVMGTRLRVNAFRTTPTRAAPMTGAIAEPRPPVIRVPPNTTAAITWSSKPFATVACISPSCPANTAL